MTEVSFPLPDTTHTATSFYKLGRRRALAISVIGGSMVIIALLYWSLRRKEALRKRREDELYGTYADEPTDPETDK